MVKGSDTDTWRSKFVKLSDDFDRQQAVCEGREKVLCRAIVRLAMASHGLDAAIDPLLGQVRDLVRKGVRSDKLLEQLDGLTDALIRVDRGGKAVDASLLFQFLGHCAASVEEKTALEQVRERYEAGRFSDQRSLFMALLQVVGQKAGEQPQAQPAAKPGILGKLFGSNGRKAGGGDVNVLRAKMISLLDSLEIPQTEQARASRFKERMHAELNEDGIEGALDDLVDLLLAIKGSIQKEQEEIEAFLSTLTGRLGELENQAGGVVAITSEVAREGAAMNSAVSGHMEDLRNSARGATDLTQLQSLLNSRLDAIVRQIEGHRDREANRISEMEEQMQGLRGRLQEVELEAGELRTRLRAAHRTALLDSLTGLPNRAAYDERLQQEYQRWRRFGGPLSVVVWDIDYFKSINDRFGHRAGDKAIAIIGGVLASGVRETDFIARYGGEEFVMLLPGADAKAALAVAENLRVKVKSCGFNSEGSPTPITVSCGLTALAAGDTPDAVFERADQALYQAKQQGRDRCVVAA